MTIEEILNIDIRDKNILIIGEPASGKTWLCEQIEDAGHLTIHTDSYKDFGYERSLYELMRDITDYQQPTMIEGILGYRLLRKGQELGIYKADIVIICETTPEKQAEIYMRERDQSKIKYMPSLKKGLKTIFNEFKEMTPKEDWPEFITFNNNY